MFSNYVFYFYVNVNISKSYLWWIIVAGADRYVAAMISVPVLIEISPGLWTKEATRGCIQSNSRWRNRQRVPKSHRKGQLALSYFYHQPCGMNGSGCGLYRYGHHFRELLGAAEVTALFIYCTELQCVYILVNPLSGRASHPHIHHILPKIIRIPNS